MFLLFLTWARLEVYVTPKYTNRPCSARNDFVADA